MKNIRALLVYISILILAINYLLYHTINNYIYKDVLRIIALSMLLFSIIVNRKIKISNALIAIIAYLLFGVLIGSTLSYNLLFIILIIYAISYNCKVDKVKNRLFIISTICIILYVLFYKLGIIQNTITNYSGRIRNTLGFDNVNALSIIVISFVCLLSCNCQKMRKIVNLLILVGIIIITKYTDSRTLLYSTIAYISVDFIINNKIGKKIVNKLFSNTIFRYLFLIVTFFSPLLILAITHINSAIDIFLSYRGTILSNYIHSQNIINFLFGLSTNSEIDNSYILLFFAIGIIGYAYIIKLFSNFFKIQKNIKYYPTIITMLLYGITEGVLIRPESILSVYFWYLIFTSTELFKYMDEEEIEEKFFCDKEEKNEI